MTFQEIIQELIELSDLIDLSEYKENWKEESQKIITNISNSLKQIK